MPSQTDVIYAAAMGGLYKSVDGGTAWSKLDVQGSQSFNTVALDPNSASTVLAGTSDAGIFKSTDGGSSWVQANSGLGNLDVLSIAFYPNASTSILAGTAAGGVYRTDLGGDSWYAWNSGSSAVQVNAIGFVEPQASYIMAGTEDGAVSFDNSLPDLIVTSVSGPVSAETEQQITIANTVKNIGEGTAWGTAQVDIYFSTDATITKNDTRLAYRFVSDLGPGVESTANTVITIPPDLAGTYYIGVIADVWNYIPNESDETNNTLAGNQIIIGNRPPVASAIVGSTECASPDGTPVTLDASASYDPDGDPVTIEWSKDGIVVSTAIYFTTEPLTLGTHTYTLTVSDDKGLSDSVDVNFTVADTTPPTTVAVLSGTLGNNGWYVSDVDVELTATDTCTGVLEVHYTITGPGHDGSETVVPGDNVNINLNADGSFTVTYWAKDNAGNVEVVAPENSKDISREFNPPDVEPVLPPEPPSGYYTECVTVHLTTTDSVSGAAVTEYWGEASQAWLPYNDAVGIPVCNTATVQYRATSPAGNVHYNTVIINIDQTAPVITILNVADDGTYELGLFDAPTYTVTDDVSGVDPSSESESLTGGDGYGLGQFTYSVTAADIAGNSETVTIHFEVMGSIPGLSALVQQYAASGDIDPILSDELLTILDSALNAPNGNEQDGWLQDFVNKVQAQSGKKVTAGVAAILVNAANYVIANN